MKALLLGLVLALLGAAPGGLGAADAPPTLTVFAAASLSESLQDIAKDWARDGGGPVRFNFDASGTLAREVTEGAPADLFLSADEATLDRLDKAGLLEPGSRAKLLSNTLVVVTQADHPAAVSVAADLAAPKLGKVAIGDPATVPAGAYAKAWLQGLGLWKAVADKAVPCVSVRAVLAAVESGNVDAGVVYRTDAQVSRKAMIAFEVPRKDGPTIIYPIAMLKNAPSPAKALAFLDYLKGSKSRAVFQRWGFLPLGVSADAH